MSEKFRPFRWDRGRPLSVLNAVAASIKRCANNFPRNPPTSLRCSRLRLVKPNVGKLASETVRKSTSLLIQRVKRCPSPVQLMTQREMSPSPVRHCLRAMRIRLNETLSIFSLTPQSVPKNPRESSLPSIKPHRWTRPHQFVKSAYGYDTRL